MKLKFAMIAALALNVLIAAPVSAQITGELQADALAPTPIPQVILKDLGEGVSLQQGTLVLPDYFRLNIGSENSSGYAGMFWHLDPGLELTNWKVDNLELIKMPRLGYPSNYEHYKADLYILMKDGVASKAYVLYYTNGRGLIIRDSILQFDAPDARGVQMISGKLRQFRNMGRREVESNSADAIGQLDRWK